VLATLGKLKDGEAWIWAPKLELLKRARVPKIRTFDSSSTPTEEGEVREPETLADVDVDALRAELAAPEPEPETKGPRVDVEAIRRAAHEDGRREGYADGFMKGQEATRQAVETALRGVVAMPEPAPALTVSVDAARATARKPQPVRSAASAEALSRPQMRVLEALAFWAGLGISAPTRYQLAAAAGYSPTSGGFGNVIGSLRAAGYVEYPGDGRAALTEAGHAVAPTPAGGRARDRLKAVLSAPQAKVLDALPHDGSPMSRETLADATGYSATSGGFGNLLGSLRSLGLVSYPRQGFVAVETWVWEG
jgi:hypothetical protein